MLGLYRHPERAPRAAREPIVLGTYSMSPPAKGCLMSLTVDLSRPKGFWLLSLRGDLDYAECAAFRMNVERVLKERADAIVVDLTDLAYLDSSGLGQLLSLSKEFGAQGGRLVLVTNETVDNILSLTRLNGIFATAATLDEALQVLDRA